MLHTLRFSLQNAVYFTMARRAANFKPTRCTHFRFILGMKLHMVRTVPLSIIRSFSLYTQQWYMSYRFVDSLRVGCWSCSQAVSWHILIAVCTVKNSWWWTEELSETCRVSFQKWIWEMSAYSWFKVGKSVHHHTFQINQPTRCNSFSSLLLDV